MDDYGDDDGWGEQEDYGMEEYKEPVIVQKYSCMTS